MSPIEQLRQWVGKTEENIDTIDQATCGRMAATLDHQQAPSETENLPALWHWLFFHQPQLQSNLGPDGHGKRGGFLPPVDLPRRMWAGGRLEFLTPLVVGDRAVRRSQIKSVEMKTGKSGNLCFVTVHHEISANGVICLHEEHDIVYRENPAPGIGSNTPSRARTNANFTKHITPSPELLFRYSALTFNAHKIHYDPDYCRDVEGYPGLVFHGPLTATLLVQLATDNTRGETLKSFQFRALSPLYDTAAFELRGWREDDAISLQAVDANGDIAMQARAGF